MASQTNRKAFSGLEGIFVVVENVQGDCDMGETIQQHAREDVAQELATSGIPVTNPSFCYKIIDSAFSIFITWIPILNSRIFDFCIFGSIDFYYCCMQLIFVSHWSSTSFEITDI